MKSRRKKERTKEREIEVEVYSIRLQLASDNNDDVSDVLT